MRATTRPLAVRLAAGPLATGLLAAALLGCAEPQLPDDPEAEGIEAPAEEPTPEPARAELVAATRDLMASVERAQALLSQAAAADGAADARRSAEQALAQLVVGAGAGATEGPSVFPSVTSEQRGGAADAEDALTLTLTAASDAGGAIGRAVADALRDPLAGDLGAWQRDPAGLLALASGVADDADDLAAVEQAVRSLPGDGTRAVAWAVLASEAEAAEDIGRYAERGAAHLAFVIAALEAATGASAEGNDADPATGGDA